MNEFARMIYEQWRHNNDIDSENNIDWGDYDEAVHKIYDFLNEKIADELECATNQRVWQVEENALSPGLAMRASAYLMARLI